MVSAAARHPSGAVSLALRRLGVGVLTLWAAVTAAFFGLRVAAGDPTAALLSQGLATPAQAENLRVSLGLDQPLLVQYARFLGDLARGDLGTSLYTERGVAAIILEQAGPTATLALSGLAIATIFGTLLGLVAGSSPATVLGRTAGAIAGVATAVPVAVTGVVLLLAAVALSDGFPWLLPLTRGGNVLLPALTLGVATSGALARVLQAGLEGNLAAPYLLAARARGIAGGPRLLWHALRPALPLAISFLSLEAALLMGGTVVTETVFARPGLGRLLVRSILTGDFPVVQGLVLVTAALYTLSHVVAEVLSAVIDPRLRSAA